MKKGLGRGFESLIPTNLLDESFDPTAEQDGKVSQLRELNISDVKPDSEQPRRFFDEDALLELSESIKEHGVVQPLVVTQEKDGSYQIVAGERRWRAAKMAGLKKIPCIIRSMKGQQRLEVSLIENLQRRDLNALETATAYLKLRDQFNMTLEQIGQRVGGKSISAVSNTLRLLKLPKFAQEALFEGKLSEGQARPLIGLPEEFIEKLIERIIREDWSARRIEQAIVLWKQAKNSPIENAKPVEIPHEEIRNQLTNRLQTKVRIKTNTKGAGQIVIPFKNNTDLERIKKIIS